LEPRFDVYVTGQILDGFQQATVIAGLARLFAIEESAAAMLVNGTQRRVKADCDKATALKYREALSGIGAAVLVERQTGQQPGTDDAPFSVSGSVSSNFEDASAQATSNGDSAWELAPAGALMSDPAVHTPVALVNVPAYDLAEVGALIPSITPSQEPINPDISYLRLDPLDPIES